MDLKAEFGDFYDKCLSDLKARGNYSETFLPLLDRYVTLTAMLVKLNLAIVDDEIAIEHVNRAGHKNEVTSPKWRMFLHLNKEANMLARELGLSPSTAPVKDHKAAIGVFDLSDNLKIAK